MIVAIFVCKRPLIILLQILHTQGYRLPHMNELIAVWNANGGQVSPEGFEKNGIYWALEEGYSLS
ncbi:MAG TPA: hypothetical protein EYG67_04165 [Campylobacterales bacterium]|nr:hypothetical protein [Campylobacterales bacterium]